MAAVNSTHPSDSLLVHVGDARGVTEDQKHFSSLLYRATKTAKYAIVCLKSYSAHAGTRNVMILGGFQGRSRQESGLRYW